MQEPYLIMPLEIIRGTVFEDYVQIPDASDPSMGQDLTGITLKAELRDKPNGTLLATFTCTANLAPPDAIDSTGWVQIRLDNSIIIPSYYHRGAWALLASIEADNPSVVAAGPVDIISQPVSW